MMDNPKPPKNFPNDMKNGPSQAVPSRKQAV